MNRAILFFLAAGLLALGLACATFERYGAPKFRNEGVHEGAAKMTPEACFSCHLEGKDGAPVAPDSMKGRTDCAWCHLR
jgi:hypothetical protein